MAEKSQNLTKSANIDGRVQPQDLVAEKSVLGAIMLSDAILPEIMTIIKPQDFYDPAHQTIFTAILNLYDNHKSIDLVTVTAMLREMKELKNVGGGSYLAELTNFVRTTSHAKDYAEIIEKNSIRRKLVKAGAEITNKAFEDSANVDELIGSVEKELYEVSDKMGQSDCVPMSDLLSAAFDRIEMLHNNKGILRGLKTGFKDLDNMTAGFQKGDLIIVGARPAMGKTTFAQNLAMNIALTGKKVLFFSMEMASNEIIDRMISESSGVDSWHMRTGNLTDEEFSKIGDALGEMDELPIFIDDTSSMTITEIRNKARRAKHNHDIDVIVIDYLQLINGSERYRYSDNRVQEVTEVSRGLKILARELEVPVIALAQLSRNVTGRDDPRPVLSDLRESGSIEQDADLVMFLHRPDYYHMNDDNYEPTNITELLIQKHRHGAVGKIELYFNKEISRFMSLDKKHE